MSKTTTSQAERQVSKVKRTGAHAIMERCVCITLSCHYLGNHRRVNMEDKDLQNAKGEKIEVDKKQVSVTKKIMDASMLWPAMKVIILTKAYLKSRAVSAHRVFGERTHLIPVALVEEVDRELTKFSERIQAEAQSISENWDYAIKEQEAKLGPDLFNRNDYVDAEYVRNAYGIEWSYVSFAAPEKLTEVDHALYESAARKAEKKMDEAFQEVRLALRQMFRDTVKELVRKLEPDNDGKRKQIRGTVLEDLADFMQTWKARDVTDDAEMDRMVKALRAATKGVDASRLRDDDDERARLLSTVQEAVGKLDVMVEKATRRAISFGAVQ